MDAARPARTRRYSLFDLSDRLRSRGWQVPAYTMVPNIQDMAVMRILVRHGFSRDMAELLLDDHAAQRWNTSTRIRVAHKMTAEEGVAYTH